MLNTDRQAPRNSHRCAGPVRSLERARKVLPTAPFAQAATASAHSAIREEASEARDVQQFDNNPHSLAPEKHVNWKMRSSLYVPASSSKQLTMVYVASV